MTRPMPPRAVGAIALIERTCLTIIRPGGVARGLAISRPPRAGPVTSLVVTPLPRSPAPLHPPIACGMRTGGAVATLFIYRALPVFRSAGRVVGGLGICRTAGARPITLLGWVTPTRRGA